MSHGPHLRTRRVLGDDCEECLDRASNGLNGLSQLDNGNLRELAAIAREKSNDPFGIERPQAIGASFADMKAVETLRLAARIVYRSEITEEEAR